MHWHRFILLFSTLAGASGILIAAAGAHMPGIDQAGRELIERAALYQLIHAAMLFSMAQHYRPGMRFAAFFFMAGICCFCGGIFLRHLTDIALPARIVPAGGISFALGWLMLPLGTRFR